MTATFWFNEIFSSLVFAYLISGAISNLRLNVGRRWMLISGLIVFYLVCITLAILLVLNSRSLDRMNHSMQFSKDAPQVTVDWQNGQPNEKRNKNSLAIARIAYVSSGVLRDYIDLNGNPRTYVPNDEDRKERASFITSLDQSEQAATLYFYAGIGWLLVPLLGTGIGLTGLGQRIGKSLAKIYPQAKAK